MPRTFPQVEPSLSLQTFLKLCGFSRLALSDSPPKNHFSGCMQSSHAPQKHYFCGMIDSLVGSAPFHSPLTHMQDIEPFLTRVRDPALRHSLAYGVGLLTETQQPAEQAVVNLLFESGAIQVCMGGWVS
eukprot:1160128-Pelagomonas_calceolata.AAC.11